MKIKGLIVAFFGAMGAIAMLANSASAAPTTEAVKWYINEAAAPLVGDQALHAEIDEHPGIGLKFELNSEIGGRPIELTATAVECVSCQITNAEVTTKAGAVAMAKGKLKFTGVTADAPAGCKVRNATETGALGVIETKALEFHADWMAAGEWGFQQWFPETGKAIATIYLEAGGCAAIAGPYNLTGTVFSESEKKTNVAAAVQEVEFSPLIQAVTGAELKLGSIAAELTGTAALTIGGNNKFTVH